MRLLIFIGLPLILLSGCDWFQASKSPQELYERSEIYADYYQTGVYYCTKCGAPLFHSKDKIHESSRWPLFSSSLEHAVEQREMVGGVEGRTEITCANCRLQLGHVCKSTFSNQTRYCTLSSSLRFGKAAE